jgi:putative nucleotidyltransferase with HDIG domain
MLLSLPNSRIRQLYQPRAPPTAARATRRENDFFMETYPPIGDLTAPRVYPSKGVDASTRRIRRLPGPGAPRLMLLYVAALAVIASALCAWLITRGYSFGNPYAVAALAVLGGVAERSRVRLSSNLELSISLLPTLFAAVVFGPVAAMIVAAASIGSYFRAPYMKWGVYTLSEAITGATTGLVALHAATLSSNAAGAIAIAAIAGAMTAQTLDTAFAATTVTIRGTGRPTEIIQTLAPVLAASVPFYTPIVALLAYAYTEVSPFTLPLFLAPALAAQHLFGMYQRQRALAGDLTVANTQLEKANLSFAAALVATLDARDRYTAGHSAAVAIYSRDIAARMGLSDMEQQKAHLAGLVHDIGKVGLPPGLLEKDGPLTLEERRLMQQHSAIGERILRNVEDYEEVAGIVRHHHERVDGNGYPDGLCGDAIPLLARIIAVADAYNAMTSDRPYREAMPSRVARLRLAQAVDSQFDTSVVAAFEAVLTASDEDYRTGRRPDFEFSRTPALESVQVAGAA